MLDNDTPRTTRNSTRWFRRFAIGDITFCHKSSFFSLIMRSWSISTPKRSWMAIWVMDWVHSRLHIHFTPQSESKKIKSLTATVAVFLSWPKCLRW